METPTDNGRDPVCIAIESLLTDLQARGEGFLSRFEKEDAVHLAFAGIHAKAVIYDVALIRLAAAMMDDPRFYRPLVAALDRYGCGPGS
jgi:hypothetical protein